HGDGERVRPLASALLKAVRGSGRGRGTQFSPHAAPFGHLQARISALAGNRRAAALRVSSRRAAVTAFVSVAVVITNVSVGAGQASAQSPPDGGRCAPAAMSQPMSTLNVSPYFAIKVPQMSSAVQS